MDYRQTIDYLFGLQVHGIKLGLDNPRALLALFDNPQNSFRSIHIAGTNGKGSTSAMLASMLRAGGHSVGLFTSPHILSFTERIVVDGEPISEADVIRLAGIIRDRSGALSPTFFEVVTVMGFLYFRERGVDVAVVETGMGGRLDATNTLEPELTIITPVGMDHREFLGDTLKRIALEKAGITKPHVPLVLARQEPEAFKAIAAMALQRRAEVILEGRHFWADAARHEGQGIAFDYRRAGGETLANLYTPLRGSYQSQNASVAVAAMEAFEGRSIMDEDFAAIVRRGLAGVIWPGRLELVRQGTPEVFVDGAHNAPALRALAAEIISGGAGLRRGMCLVLGIMADKDVRGALAEILPLAGRVILAAPAYGRAAKPDALLEVAAGLGVRAEAAPTVREAMERALAQEAQVLVTGSFYLMEEALDALGGRAGSEAMRKLREHPPLKVDKA